MSFPYHRKVKLTNCPDLLNVRYIDEGCVPMVRKMHRNGIAVDIQKLDAITCDLMRLEDEYKRQIYEYIPKQNLDSFTQAIAHEDGDGDAGDLDAPTSDLEFNLNSGDQLAELLFTHLGIGTGQKLKLTKGGARLATDKKQLEILNKGAQAHPVIGLILKYREAFKLRTTYTEKMPAIARFDPLTDTYRIYTTFTLTRTATGRLASKAPNLMNLPFRTEIGRRIRAAFIPSPGKVFVGADFSQIELRILAHCSKDPYMLEIYRNNGDIHVATAMRAFSKTAAEVKSEAGKMLYRLPCKRVNFGICIAEGQLVLTDHGLIPIQDVSGCDRLWDGKEFVKHDGVIYKGVHPVVTYQGLTATPTHKVWVWDEASKGARKVCLETVLAKGLDLVTTGCQETPIDSPPDNLYRDPRQERHPPRGMGSLHELRHRKGDVGRQHPVWKERLMQLLNFLRSGGSTAHPALQHYSPTLLESSVGDVRELWRPWDRESFQVECRVRGLHQEPLTASHLQAGNYRAQGQRWALRTGESSVRGLCSEQSQQTHQQVGGLSRSGDGGFRSGSCPEAGLSMVWPYREAGGPIGYRWSSLAGDLEAQTAPSLEAPVYDILNAGPRHRFTCSGVLVSNCYGLAAPGLQQQLAMEGMNWTIEQCEEFINNWFRLYPGVKELMDVYYYRARRYKLVWDIFGRIRLVPEVQSQHSWIRNAGLRQAGNLPIQSGAQAFTKLAMGWLEEDNVEIRSCGWEVEPLLQVHDEILQECDAGIADEIKQLMERRMSTIPELNGFEMRVPILAEGQIMPDCWKKAA